MASAGARDTQVTIQSSSIQKVGRIPTEVWTDDVTLWANIESRGIQTERVGEVNIEAEVIRIRLDWLDAQAITDATRFVFRGSSYEVRTIDWDTDRRATVIVEAKAVVTGPGAAEAEWIKKMRDGEIVRIQDRDRRDSNNAPLETFVRAKGEYLQPEELIGGITQGARRYFVMAEDVDETFGPIRRGHFVRVRDDRLFIESVDDATYRFGGRLIVYVLITRGVTEGS